MAGTQQREKPAGTWRTLLGGYDSLTLDPSPRLRRVREEMSRPPEEAMQSAWKMVGRALLEAMRTISPKSGAGRSS
jgi:hypothetical protein